MFSTLSEAMKLSDYDCVKIETCILSVMLVCHILNILLLFLTTHALFAGIVLILFSVGVGSGYVVQKLKSLNID